MTRLMKGLTRRAAALWPNGRMEAYAALPGVPGLEERERRAHLRRGALAELADEGVLVVDEGRQPGAGDVGLELDRAEPRRPLADRSLRVTEAIRELPAAAGRRAPSRAPRPARFILRGRAEVSVHIRSSRRRPRRPPIPDLPHTVDEADASAASSRSSARSVVNPTRRMTTA